MTVAETLVLDDAINIVVLADMELRLSTQYVAREGDHNSAVFRIVRQPAALDAFACRAEIETPQGKNYYLVDDNGEFLLTQDIAVAGPGRMQLVYSDGVDIMRKTSVAHFTVMPSINAVDPSNPDFQDGLAQMQANAFTNVIGSDTTATFYNIGGSPVAVLVYPPGQGGGLDEATANQLYLRLNGTNIMSGDMRMVSDVGIDGPIGIVLGGRQAQVRWEGALILTKGQANEPVLIENNNGSNRSEVLTQLLGDARYAQLSGAQMAGPLITQTGTSNTNPGIGVGDNSTGFWRTSTYLICVMGGQTVWQSNTTEMLFGVRLNAATQPIWNLGDGRPDAAGAMDAVNRRSMDSAIAAVPRPNSRTYLTNTVDLTTANQVLLDQAFPVPNNNNRTLTVTVFPSFSGGTPSAFYDLIYTINLATGIEARVTCYPTAGAYMTSPVRFAATVPGNNNQIQVQVSVRLNAPGQGTLTIVGSGTDRRSYVTIEEQQN